MAENKVEIEVELSGAKGVRDGFKSVGKAGKQLVENMSIANSKLGEGLGEIGESVFSLKDSFLELGTGFKEMEKTGSAGMLSLLGPIGAVAAAGVGLFQVLRMISGAALQLEEDERAMTAAASDLQQKLEALAEKGVVLAAREMVKFSKATLLAQASKEKLQFAQEKLSKQVLNVIEAEEKLRKSQKEIIRLEKQRAIGIYEMDFAQSNLLQATQQLEKANNKLNRSIKKTLDFQNKVSTAIMKAEEDYVSYEETSAVFLKGKNAENVAILKNLELVKAETSLKERDFKRRKIEIEQQAELSLLKIKDNEKNREFLLQQSKELKQKIEAFDKEDLLNKRAAFQRKKLIEEENKLRKENQRKRAAEAAQVESKRLQSEKLEEQARLKAIAEEARISQLRIELDENETNKARQLALLRYNTALSLAKDSQNQILIAELQFQKELTQIDKSEETKRLQNQKRLNDESRAFELESRQFYIEQIESETDRELAKLDLQYERRYEMAKGNQDRIKDLEARYLIERMKIMDKETNELKNRFGELFTTLGEGLAESAAGALVLGESFKKSIVGVLQSLAKEAAVQALMETAKGTAALFLNPAQAANHFTAAGIFAGAATAAGVAGSALSTSAGGGGGGGGNFSPSGAPQNAQTVQDRPQAQEQTLVFNVNFSGAVVYDTKKAAEQALADRVTNIMNRRRRGAPR